MACGGNQTGGQDAAPDECLRCATHATCDLASTPACSCDKGYAGDGRSDGAGCLDIDECATHADNCVAGSATCTNIPGGFTCACNPGFTGDGTATGAGCTDVDECAAGTSACDNFTCVNTVGAYRCEGLYAVEAFDGVLARLNPDTFALLDVVRVQSSGGVSGVNSMVRDPVSGTVYAIAKVAGVTRRAFGTLDLETATFSTIAGVDKFATLEIAADGTLFGATGIGATVPSTLYTLDRATGTPTFFATLSNIGDGQVICYNPDNQRMYHWNGNSTAVMEWFSLTTPGLVTKISPGLGTGEIYGCRYAGNDRFLVYDIDSRVRFVTTAGVVSPVPDATTPMFQDIRATMPATMTAPHTVRPIIGSSSGGTNVTIRGIGLTGSTAVSFGGVPATSFTIDSDRQITAIAPAVAAGTGAVDITVQGVTTFTSTWPKAFTYANAFGAPARSSVQRSAVLAPHGGRAAVRKAQHGR